MSLKAKLEAVIYAAEEPVTLAQLAVLFAADALEWKAEQKPRLPPILQGRRKPPHPNRSWMNNSPTQARMRKPLPLTPPPKLSRIRTVQRTPKRIGRLLRQPAQTSPRQQKLNSKPAARPACATARFAL